MGLPSAGYNMPASKEQQQFDSLNELIRRRGGYVVSVPGRFPLEFQIAPASSLPVELANLGYHVAHIGQTTRLEPGGIVEIVTRRSRNLIQHRYDGFVPMAIYSIALPKD
jgi:hypothetical protein